MTEFFKSPFRIFQLRGGQNGQLLDTFLRELQQSGFAKITVRRHIRTAEHLLYWARLSGISPSAFNEDTVDEFARHLTRCRCKGYAVLRTVGWWAITSASKSERTLQS
jgi:integrase/recombinase XerD